jgi:hypothetical protein
MGKKIIVNKDRAELLSKADALLVRIGETEGIIKADLREKTDEIEKIKARHEQWNAGMINLLTDLKKQLMTLMKKNSGLFLTVRSGWI